MWKRGVVLAAMVTGGAAGAQMTNHNGAEPLARGQYAVAERVIVAQQRVFPRDTDLLLNLAQVYAHTGRAADARQAYVRVLSLPDERLRLAGGSFASSHTLAQAGMRRLGSEIASAR